MCHWETGKAAACVGLMSQETCPLLMREQVCDHEELVVPHG